jgi:hypothetical protein
VRFVWLDRKPQADKPALLFFAQNAPSTRKVHAFEGKGEALPNET